MSRVLTERARGPGLAARVAVTVLFAACVVWLSNCATPPRVARDSADLRSYPASATWLRIRGLPDADVEGIQRFTKVDHLDMYGGLAAMPLAMTEEGFVRLGSLDLPTVTTLTIGLTPQLTDRSLEAIGQLQSLRILVMRQCSGFTADGLSFVARLPSLHHLDLRGCARIDDSWVDVIVEARHLRYLGLTGTGISSSGIGAIQQALPTCLIDGRVDYWEVERVDAN